MKKTVFILALLVFNLFVFAQTGKRPLTHPDILNWNRITEKHISNDGSFIVYKQEPWKGNPVLKISSPQGVEKITVECATSAKITADSKFVIYTLKPSVDSVRMLKLKKTKKEDMPQEKLVIYNFKTGEKELIEKLKSWRVPAEWSGWMAWQTEVPKDTLKIEKGKSKSYPLSIKNLKTGGITKIPAVSDYTFAEEEKFLAVVSEGKDSSFEEGVYVFDLDKGTNKNIFNVKGEIKQLSVSKTGQKVAFLASLADKKEKETNYKLYLWQEGEEAKPVVDNANEAIPENYKISENGSLLFSDNEKRLFFGTDPKKTPKDTTILEEEIPVLDVWHWNEEVLQTVQIHNKEANLRKTYLAVLHIQDNKTVQLETELFTGIRKIKNGDADKILAYSNRPYAVQTMWEGHPVHNDFYLIDMYTGNAELIKKDCRATPSVSSAGKYLFWYNAIDTTWNTYNIETGSEFVITTGRNIQVANELNDIPNPPSSYYTPGWLENDEAFFVYDRYDMWKVDPENKTEVVRCTPNGREQKITYRLVRFNSKRDEGIDRSEPLLLKAHNEVSRADSYYSFDMEKMNTKKIFDAGNFCLSTPQKAKDKDVIVFTKEDFQTYPNLIATDLSFKKQIQISNAAPQQKEFLWGTAELVSWTSLDGRALEGTLHKPENFDPQKKYPMIVNFYEKSSDGLLKYHMPECHRSTVDYHYYTSNGYLVFNPDVYYRDGYPGESAYNCVMPGVTAMIARGFVDERHIGAQGHSWGGYQVAYLATRTKIFAAIESGAPVVNMFSAYGGIRWGSGLNRAFQYEHTQSRIGKSIWESPLRYVENSPLFTLDKVETPILIMHNDNDGAVPWYQGIEYFIGLRRLKKPSWLLNYNQADHWPTKVRDKYDFQIRLAQFFDHYLKEKPMPRWMKEGIPATKKGVDLGYDLVE